MKRFAILLAGIMLAAAGLIALPAIAPATAQADDNTTSDVTITVSAPMATADTTTTPQVTIPEGANYSISECVWVTVSSGSYIEYASPESFSAGNEYFIKVTLIPNGAYHRFSFDRPTVVGGDLEESSLSGDSMICIIKVVAEQKPVVRGVEPIESITLKVTAPTPGTTAGEASYISTGVVTLVDAAQVGYGWEEEPDNGALCWLYSSGLVMQSDAQFESGTTYQLLFQVVVTDTDVQFTDATQVILTGDSGVRLISSGQHAGSGQSKLEVLLSVPIVDRYSVSFDMHGHYTPVPRTQDIVAGGHATCPSSPVNNTPASDYHDSGLIFYEWINCLPGELTSSSVRSLSSAGGAIFDFASEEITSHTTVYACYKGTLSTIAYDLGASQQEAGGTVKSGSVYDASGDYSVSMDDTVLEGTQATVYAQPDSAKVFVGWSTSTSMDDIVSTDAVYSFEFERGTTLYALFAATVEVTFNLNGGAIDGNTSNIVQTVQSGGKAADPGVPTKEGLTFDGWYKDGTKVDLNDATFDESTELKALWRGSIAAETYDVTEGEAIHGGSILCNVVDGQFVWAAFPVLEGALVTLTATPSAGYLLVGWALDDPTGEIVSEAETYTIDSFAKDLEIYAVFAKAATLTFDLGGGTLDGKTGTITIEAKVGYKINLPGAPTKDGYTFKCWKGSEYDAGAEYTVEGDHEFTAEWEKTKPTIPPTGDATPLALALALLVLSGAGLAFARRRG